MSKAIAVLTLMLTATGVLAASPGEVLQIYAAQARKDSPSFKEFSAANGDRFYHAAIKHSSGKQVSCATCHTDSPRNAGRHERTNKEIAPLAPSVNKDRFTDAAAVEKWFKRNCHDVLERECSAQEKGDFITYVLSIK
jgi:hypothetical protein